MYRYLLVIWILTMLSATAMAQNPDTSSMTNKNNVTIPGLKKPDTVIHSSFVPKVKKEKVYHPDSTHSPHKAIMRSLMVPGWGQVYNHHWWKVPVIYGALGLIGSAYVFNETNYKVFLAISKYREFGTKPAPTDKYYNQYQQYAKFGDQAINDATDGYRRNRDLSILGFAGFWGINLIDAYIDAKFINSYTVDNNLSMKVSPALLNQPVYAQNYMGSYIPGIKITFTLK